MADSGGSIVDPYPSASHVFGATEESIGESGVAPIDASNGEGVLFTHDFISASLIAIEALMATPVRSVEDGEREARKASDMDFIGGKTRGGANGVVIGVLDVGKMDVPVVLVFVTDHG